MVDQAENINELREDFSKCDANGDGQIQFEEFVTLLENLGAQTTDEENRVGFEEIDTDKNGAISFDEFAAWFND